jgi:hypothetical protein
MAQTMATCSKSRSAPISFLYHYIDLRQLLPKPATSCTQAETETAADAREALAQRARTAAEQVIDEQGITVHDYNTVLAAAEGDQDLERRLLDAAHEVL